MTAPTLTRDRFGVSGLLRRSALILPRAVAGQPQTLCASCPGLLGYVSGRWCHVDFCVECLDPGVACPVPRRRHRGCDDPQPEVCAHVADWSCGEPVSLVIPCAYGMAQQTCCGCCWLPDTDLPTCCAPAGPAVDLCCLCDDVVL